MIGYLDIPSGISGDMFLGCLVDGGWPIEQLRDVIRRLKLPAGSWEVGAKQVMKGALRATRVEVNVAEGPAAMGPVGDVRVMSVGPIAPARSSPLFVHGHAHSHRNLGDVTAIIRAADLPSRVKDRAIGVFGRLAAAEAKVHGTTIDAIHFHEVGALDAIVDIVGTVAGIEALGVERLYASPVPLGHGWVDTAHGKLPLPAPATLELLSAAGAPTRPAPGEGELVTPTGAALVAELATWGQPRMRLEKVALGAGGREFAWPNVARLWLGTALPELSGEGAAGTAVTQFVLVETNIDDMNPQLYAAVTERLVAAGARDVWLTPVQMKKGRPGVVLSAIAPPEAEAAVAETMLAETTSIGVRVREVKRYESRRELRPVSTPFGEVRVKVKWVGANVAGALPEFDDCVRIARDRGASVKAVWEAAVAAGWAEFRSGEIGTSAREQTGKDDC